MGDRLAGTYLGHCGCQQVCGCAVDQLPTGPDGQCHRLFVHNVTEGSLDGNVTTMRNAAFGFASEFVLGKSSGRSSVFGDSFEARYGEVAQLEYAG